LCVHIHVAVWVLYLIAPAVRVSTASFIAGKRAQTLHVMILVLFYIVWVSEF